jgi:hypothetical protein
MLMVIFGQTESMTLEQCRDILGSGFASIRSYSCRFEGELVVNSSDGQEGQDTPGSGNRSIFQGTFSYRDDGSVALQIYQLETSGHSLPSRTEYLLRDRKLITIQQSPEQNTQPHQSSAEKALLSSLDLPGSPMRLFMPWLCERLSLARVEDFEPLGWESIDGRRCYKFALNSGSRWVVWVDVERGANPIRYERWRRDKLVCRSSTIRLISRRSDDGMEVWIPESGKIEWYSGREADDQSPQSIESYHLLPDSSRVNNAISDSTFAPAGPGDPRRPSLSVPLASDFESALRRQRPSRAIAP